MTAKRKPRLTPKDVALIHEGLEMLKADHCPGDYPEHEAPMEKAIDKLEQKLFKMFPLEWKNREVIKKSVEAEIGIEEPCEHDETDHGICLYCEKDISDILTDRAHDRMDMER